MEPHNDAVASVGDLVSTPISKLRELVEVELDQVAGGVRYALFQPPPPAPVAGSVFQPYVGVGAGFADG